MTIEQLAASFKDAFKSKNAEAEALAKELATVKGELAEAHKALENIKASKADGLDALAAEVNALKTKLAEAETLKAQAVAQIETAGKTAAKIAAAVGAEPVEISPAVAVESPKTAQELWDKYCAMPNGAEKVEFYNQNRKAFLGLLGIK